VTITLTDIYEKLIVVETKLAPILDPDVGVMAKQRDHEGRLRELEQEVVRRDDLAKVRAQTVAIVTLMLLILGASIGLIQAIGPA
jgi:hypothetical protein